MSSLTMQLPDSILAGAKRIAERQNLTLDEYVTRMLEEVVRMDEMWNARVERGRQVSRERYQSIIRNGPDVPPIPGDELE